MLSRDEVATRALHSTSDFPEILAAVTNKTLRQAYEAYPRTFPLFCRQVLATDFKAMHRVQLGEAPQLLKVGESGEFKRGTLGESKESYRIETYGRVVAITRQVLINDDLDAFTRIPAMYGNSIAQLESDVVWDIVTSNPAMADGTALFHSTHKNLAGSGAALGVDSVGLARAAMRKQTGLDKKTVLNIRPAFLIVPAALELKAEQLVAQNLVPAQSGNVVPQSIRTLSPIAEPRLDAASETAWYLAASPNQIDTIEYAYLEGQQGAYIETRNGFDVDGVEIKCRLDFGAKAIDWRGLYKNPGA
ncbi:Mu-like prophage major head subunit gpT family protein [Stappia sp.]|uniref:phage major capsid protein n=1 Tax=Stappia sp. TaxID=1870903 RepID=UPI0032D934BB